MNGQRSCKCRLPEVSGMEQLRFGLITGTSKLIRFDIYFTVKERMETARWSSCIMTKVGMLFWQACIDDRNCWIVMNNIQRIPTIFSKQNVEVNPLTQMSVFQELTCSTQFTSSSPQLLLYKMNNSKSYIHSNRPNCNTLYLKAYKL